MTTAKKIPTKKILMALAAIIAAGWYYATPYLAVRAMKAAADRGDAQALSAYVDYPSVRESLKSGLKARMAGAIVRESADNPLAAFGKMLARSLVDRMVDAMVTPQGLAGLMRAKEPSPRAEAPPQPGPPSGKGGKEKTENDGTAVSHGYTGWNRFEIVAARKDEPARKVTMVLRREGFANWKLAAIELGL